MTETVRRRMVPNDSFPGSIALYAEEKAAVAEDTMASPYANPNARRHAEALKEVAKFVRELDLNEPRLETLWVINARLGGDAFEPGPNQRDLLAGVGDLRPPPAPADFVSELVSAGLEDIITAQAKELRQVDNLKSQIAKLEPASAQVGELEAELETARRERDEARVENERLRRQLDFFSERQTARESASHKPRKKPSGNGRRKTAKAA